MSDTTPTQRTESELQAIARVVGESLPFAIWGVDTGAVNRILYLPITVPGIGEIRMPPHSGTYNYDKPGVVSYAFHGATYMEAVNRIDLPFVVYAHPSGEAILLRTRKQVRKVLSEWAAHMANISNKAAVYAHRISGILDQVGGTVAITNSDGDELTGAAAFTERLRKADEIMAVLYRQTLGNAARFESRTELVDAIIAEQVPVGEFPLDEELVVDSITDKLAAVADDVREWITDGSYAASAAQEQVLQRIASAYQAGVRAARNAADRAAAIAAYRTARTGILGNGLEDGPKWWHGQYHVTLTALYTGGHLAVSYAAPSTGRWSHSIVLAQPRNTDSQLGTLALDDPVVPPGWSVTHAGGRVTIARTVDEAPAAGNYLFDLTARNAIGPSRCKVTVTVA